MSAGGFRLPAGGLVDRGQTLSFTFDGRAYTGHAGDTLASALLANGVRLVGRSFKYHRPRGILTAGSEEPNALVELRGGDRREPNSRATTAELYDGLLAASQNRWPSLGFDMMAVNSLLSPFFVAGFYYKTFMWPSALWEKLYEPVIRRAAGLGRASGLPDPDLYERQYAFCDMLVIGAGPAGLMAALTAARAGARVILADEDFRLGGRLLAERCEIDGQPAVNWVEGALAELRGNPDVTLLPRTAVFGVYDGGSYGAVEKVADHLPVPLPHQPRQRLWKITARRAVLASGALERPLVFGDNDRPGVMLAGAVRAYVNRFAAAPGKQAAIFTATDDGWRTAADLRAAGIGVAAIIDPRQDVAAPVRALAGNAPVFVGGVVSRALGGKVLRGIELGGGQRIDCDALAVSGGWSPNIGLASHLGGRPVWDENLNAFVAGPPPPGLLIAGAAAGHFTTAACLASGAEAGGQAAADCGFAATPAPLPACTPESAGAAPVWRVKSARGKCFVDFQHDVTDKDIEMADREGYRSVEHVKRYTTLGMATDQGRSFGSAGLAILAEARKTPIPDVGITTFRPPYVPVAIGALAGEHRGPAFRPVRLAPSHEWAAAQGAVFVDAGQWKRAQYFPRPGEKDWLETVNREVLTTRTAVGFCDVSTLGKIDVFGDDAGEFLERVYINGWKKLAVGKARYGVMLREDGVVMDDGTTSRLRDDYYFMTTTTANGGKVFQHLEYCRQVLWPELDVHFVSVTDQWAQFSIAGPQARATLRKLTDADLSNAALPYMGAQEIRIGGVPGRIFRLSFSGELAYEIAAPARYGNALAAALAAAGAEFGIAPYGTEALGVMRVEKGHAAGNELNGNTTARDLGMARMMSRTKDYIGRRMAERPALTDPLRPALAGFKPVDPAQRLRAGAHFIAADANAVAENDLGYMTSAAFSPMLGHWIGLGLVSEPERRMGSVIRAHDPVRGGDVLVEVCSPIFWDPEGVRLRG